MKYFCYEEDFGRDEKRPVYAESAWHAVKHFAQWSDYQGDGAQLGQKRYIHCYREPYAALPPWRFKVVTKTLTRYICTFLLSGPNPSEKADHRAQQATLSPYHLEGLGWRPLTMSRLILRFPLEEVTLPDPPKDRPDYLANWRGHRRDLLINLDNETLWQRFYQIEPAVAFPLIFPTTAFHLKILVADLGIGEDSKEYHEHQLSLEEYRSFPLGLGLEVPPHLARAAAATTGRPDPELQPCGAPQ